MATIYNSQLTKELVAGAKIQTSKEQAPTQLAEKVVPVMEVNPKLLRVCNIVRSTLLIAPTTLYTTPTDRDFYIVSAWIQASGAEASASRIITVTIDKVAQVLLQNLIFGGGTATTCPTTSNSINPVFPIKLDRGSNIVISGTGANGAVGIIGYTVENNM